MQLRLELPGGKHKLLKLEPGKTVRFGGQAPSEIVIQGAGLLPVHCGFVVKGNQCQVVASKAAGQVQVNGVAVSAAVLHGGDRVSLGKINVVLIAEAGQAPAQPASKKPAKPEDEFNLAALSSEGPLGDLGLAPLGGATDEFGLAPLGGGSAFAELAPLTPLEGTSELEMVENLEVLEPAPQPPKPRAAPAGPQAPKTPQAKSPPAKTPQPKPPSKQASKTPRPQPQPTSGTLPELEVLPLGGAPLVAEPSGGALVEELGTPLPGVPHAATALPGAAPPGKAKPPRPAGPRGQWLASPVAVSGLLLVVAAPVMLIVLVLSVAGQAPHEQFATAEAEYQAGRYAQAAAAFADFVAAHPRDLRCDEARAKRALSHFLQAAERGNDISAALAAARSLARESPAAVYHATSHGPLLDKLSQITTAFLERGRNAQRSGDTAAAFDAAKQAREAFALLARLVPPALREANVEELQTQIVALERGLEEPLALNRAATAIETATKAERLNEAYRARDDLLAHYPRLAGSATLLGAMRQVASAEVGAVKLDATSQADGSVEAVLPLQTRSISAARPDPASMADSGQPVAALDPHHGVLYALDGGSGRLLWRRFVGLDVFSRVVPVGNNAAAWIVVQSSPGAIVRVDAASGREVWRMRLEEVVSSPEIAGSTLVVATTDGLVEIDAATGQLQRRYRFGLPLAVGPAVDAASRRYFQPAAHSQLYVIAADQQKCTAAIYLGHDLGALTVSPVLVGRYLAVFSDQGPDDTRLQVLALDEEYAIVQTLALSGQVRTPPAVSGDLLVAATHDGAVHVLKRGNDKKKPLERVGGVAPIQTDVRRAAAPWLSIVDGQLVTSGSGMTTYDLPPAAAKRVVLAGSQIVQPVVKTPAGLFTAYRQPGQAGVVAATLASDGREIWRTRLSLGASTPLVANPQSATLAWLNAEGKLLEQPLEAFVSGEAAVEAPLVIEPVASLAGERADWWRRAHLVALESGALVAARERGQELWLIPPGRGVRTVQQVALPGTLARPVAWGQHLLVAIDGGVVFRFDPQSGLPVGDPFLPAVDFSTSAEWRGPVVTSAGRAIVASSSGVLYRLEAESETARLKLAGQASHVAPIVSDLAAVGEWVWTVDGRYRLVAFDTGSMGLAAEVALESSTALGPIAVGSRVLVSTRAGQLYCLGAQAAPLWQIELSPGPLAGIAADGQHFVLCSTSGVVWAVSIESGQAVGRAIETGQPLTGGPMISGGRVILMTADGAVHVLETSLADLLRPSS
jgi:outer membrane protein assembly factor BamB/TolA-binding protein